MTNRERADDAFNQADVANSQKRIDSLKELAGMYSNFLKQKAYTGLLLSQFKDKLKNTDFRLDDVISVLTLSNKDSLNKIIIIKSSNKGDEE